MRKIVPGVDLFLLILAGFCLPPDIHAQGFTISGKVSDNDTRQGIQNVNIVILGTDNGTSTDENGLFSVKTDSLPLNLVIRHLSYETQRIWVEDATSPVIAYLKSFPRLLNEVEVRSRNVPVPYFSNDRYSVLDYEVYDDLVFLLVYKYRLARSELLCRTVFGDTVAVSGRIGFRPEGLFLDCLGSLHVLSADSAYQVFLVEDSLKIGYVYGLQKFRSTLADCVASSEERLFFREESRDHLRVDFYSLDRKTSRKSYLASATDEEMLTVLYNNPLDYYYLMLDTIPAGFEAMVDWTWVRKIMYKPNRSVLCRIDSTLALFNTSEGSLDLYSFRGKYLKGLELAVKNATEGDWTREIFIDDYTSIPYTSFNKNGILSIYSVNLYDGSLRKVLQTAHSFPDKLRVQHDHLFYLYDVPGEGDTRKLYRQKL